MQIIALRKGRWTKRTLPATMKTATPEQAVGSDDESVTAPHVEAWNLKCRCSRPPRSHRRELDALHQ
ncbi:hypothetical protein KCP69_18475 [Salmonella enterica subsp. enterica]|nr:hypothetical protein KCP69_18475 [Salmonella enterica subsp. enterica]